MDTSAKFLIETLVDQGIDTYFGIPGGPVSPLFDAVLRTPGVSLVESKHETAAVFEAIGYYKSTGKIPVVLVSAGPGITNSLTGIASAKALRIPLIVITGDVAWEKQNHILLQAGGPEGLDLETTFKPHTDKVLRLKEPNLVSQEVVNYLNERSAQAPGLIIFPLHISNVNIEKPIISSNVFKSSNYKNTNSIILSVLNDLKKSKKPLLLLGNGCRRETYLVKELVNHLNIPFVTTPQAKGVVDEQHALSLGHSGLGASQWIRKYVEDVPDFVLALGTDLDDCAIGTTELIGSTTKLVHVDLNAKVFNRKYKTDKGIVSSISAFILDVLENEEELPYRYYLMSEVKKISPFDIPNFREDDSVPIAPHRALADLELAAPNVRFVTDIGEHMLFCLHYLTTTSNESFSIDLGLGSMGSGICQSIGMCLGDQRPTICVCGDGGMQMHGMEVLTAVKHKLPIIFAIFNDARYNMVYHGFKFLFGRPEPLGETEPIDFVKLFEAMGVPGKRIESPGEINHNMLKEYFNNGPAVLDIRINKDIRIKGAGRNEALKHMGEFDNG